MTSIEGKRGEPRPRPPFPAVKGLFGKPTILNNVETYANIAADHPARAPTGSPPWAPRSPRAPRYLPWAARSTTPAWWRFPWAPPCATIVEEIGGGIPDGKKFKAAQTGGPSGGCIPAEHIDIPIDYDNLIAIGSMMGSGGLIVMDEDTCMVDIAKFFLEFTVDESCGKCTPCRVGTKRHAGDPGQDHQGQRHHGGSGQTGRAVLLHQGQRPVRPGADSAQPGALHPALLPRRVRGPRHGKALSGQASARPCSIYNIDPDKCKGCTLCARICPAGAITGTVKNPTRHRHRQVHQVRRLHGEMPIRRDLQRVREESDRRMENVTIKINGMPVTCPEGLHHSGGGPTVPASRSRPCAI